MEWLSKKGQVGFVSIVGRPNVGKSTLINTILDYKLSAVTNRPHTTRRRWLGIHSTDKYQIIFVDTPGIHEIRNKMYQLMHGAIISSLENNDIVLIIADCYRQFGAEDQMLIEAVKKVNKPIVLALNKVDVADEEQIEDIKKNYCSELGDIAIFELSALENKGVEELIKHLVSLLPYDHFLFDPEQIADANLRDIATELIRETAIERLNQEVPHSIAVQIEQWQENDKKIKIHAIYYVERSSQKSILIGKDGVMIDEIKRQIIIKLKTNFDKFIDLRLHIKIMPRWQNNSSFLKELGLE